MPHRHTHYPKLLGDIGGTNVRLALQTSPYAGISHIVTLPLNGFDGPQAAIEHYLREVGAASSGLRPRTACLGMACPGSEITSR